jgi:hypothetical protein
LYAIPTFSRDVLLRAAVIGSHSLLLARFMPVPANAAGPLIESQVE